MAGRGSHDDSFAIAAFRPADALLLGEGLWGRVLDLGDGTVLKLARERCAGIGRGRRKIENEHAGLALLAGSAVADIVAAPRGHGALPGSSPLARDGFAVWLRSAKLSGTRLTPEAIARRTAREQADIGEKIGAALARLHAAFDAAAAAGTVVPIGDYAEITAVAREIGDPFYIDAVVALAHARERIPALRACHGDFNVTNILLAPDGGISGVVDLAEWGTNFPEKDISDIASDLPMLTEPVWRAYEAASGVRLDERRLALGIAENALCSAVIGERSGDRDSVKAGRSLFGAQIKRT